MGFSTDTRTARGFTVLEIVIVIAVIAILGTLVVPMYGRARSEARRVVCANNLIQIQRAMSIYADDHFSTYPALASRQTINSGKATLRETLEPLLKDERVFKCPDDKQGFFASEGASYEWNALLNNKSKDGPAEALVGASHTPMLYDYENFHPDPGNGF